MSEKAGLAVYALTAQGAKLAKALAGELGGELLLPRVLAKEYGCRGFDSLPSFVASRFHEHPGHVFVAAAGVAVRAIAPVLKGKDMDPAVVVMDQRGHYVISLISGHLGGANELARSVAQVTGGQAVITTATDVEGLPAIDDLARERGLAVADAAGIKAVSAAILAGEKVQLHDPDNWLGILCDGRLEGYFTRLPSIAAYIHGEPGVIVDHGSGPHPEGALVLHPPCLAVGLGCRKGAPADEIVKAVRETLAENGLAEKSLASLGSITAKAEEPGLIEAARILGAGLFFFEPGELAGVDAPNPSQTVREKMGTPSVCEAAAILLAGTGKLLVEKTRRSGVTVAAALVS